MSKVKLAAARELIEEKQTAAARAVLEAMPDDETAQKWLKRLPAGQKVQSRGKWWVLPAIAFVAFIFGVAIGGTGRKPAEVAALPTSTDGHHRQRLSNFRRRPRRRSPKH